LRPAGRAENSSRLLQHHHANIQILISHNGGHDEGASWCFTANQESSFTMVDGYGPSMLASTLGYVEHLDSQIAICIEKGCLNLAIIRPGSILGLQQHNLRRFDPFTIANASRPTTSPGWEQGGFSRSRRRGGRQATSGPLQQSGLVEYAARRVGLTNVRISTE
jgi:hypothetical protein